MDALSDMATLGHTGYTGTSLVVSQPNDTIVILLTNRVHPTRSTPTSNPLRRMVARLTADAIPVTPPGKGKEYAWFSGYGDYCDNVLLGEVHDEKQVTLAFDTWYRTEPIADNGVVEVSTDGETWQGLSGQFTGNSGGWKSEKLPLPEGTKYFRFRYVTDASVNGRGWYVHQVRLQRADGKVTTPQLTSTSWERRNN